MTEPPMENLYERIINLLGRTQHDPALASLIHELIDPPVIFLDNEYSTEYQFPNSGLELSFMKGPNCFS